MFVLEELPQHGRPTGHAAHRLGNTRNFGVGYFVGVVYPAYKKQPITRSGNEHLVRAGYVSFDGTTRGAWIVNPDTKGIHLSASAGVHVEAQDSGFVKPRVWPDSMWDLSITIRVHSLQL